MDPFPRPTATVALLALAAFAPLAACGGADSDEPRDTLTACLYEGYCVEYEGASLDVPATDASCAQSGATPLDVCPDAGVLGICTRQRDVTIREHVYDPATLDLERSACIAIGDAWSTP